MGKSAEVEAAHDMLQIAGTTGSHAEREIAAQLAGAYATLELARVNRQILDELKMVRGAIDRG